MNQQKNISFFILNIALSSVIAAVIDITGMIYWTFIGAGLVGLVFGLALLIWLRKNSVAVKKIRFLIISIIGMIVAYIVGFVVSNPFMNFGSGSTYPKGMQIVAFIIAGFVGALIMVSTLGSTVVKVKTNNFFGILINGIIGGTLFGFFFLILEITKLPSLSNPSATIFISIKSFLSYFSWQLLVGLSLWRGIKNNLQSIQPAQFPDTSMPNQLIK
jgi:hypothetical protein